MCELHPCATTILSGITNVQALNEVWFSSDGITWTQAASSAAFLKRIDATSVVFDNKMWLIGGMGNVLCGIGPTAELNDVWYSSDGIAWTMATAAAAFSPRQNHSSLVFNNRIWIIGGDKSCNECVMTIPSDMLNDVWYSY